MATKEMVVCPRMNSIRPSSNLSMPKGWISERNNSTQKVLLRVVVKIVFINAGEMKNALAYALWALCSDYLSVHLRVNSYTLIDSHRRTAFLARGKSLSQQNSKKYFLLFSKYIIF